MEPERKFEVDFTLRNLNFTLLSGRHHTGRSVPARSDAALVVANENNARELALRMLLVGSYQRQRTIRSATTVLCQPLANAQNRIIWIHLGSVDGEVRSEAVSEVRTSHFELHTSEPVPATPVRFHKRSRLP